MIQAASFPILRFSGVQPSGKNVRRAFGTAQPSPTADKVQLRFGQMPEREKARRDFNRLLQLYVPNLKAIRYGDPEDTLIQEVHRQLKAVDPERLDAGDRAVLAYLKADFNYAFDPDASPTEILDEDALAQGHYKLSLAREGLSDLPALKQLLQRDIQKWETELENTAEKIDPSRTWLGILRDTETETLAPDQLKQAYQQKIDQYYAFLKNNNCLTMPMIKPEAILVRNPKGSIAAYGNNQLRVNIGLEDEQSKGEGLRNHPPAVIPYATVHETAHHLQKKISPQTVYPNVLIALLAEEDGSIFYTEGWAAYMEKLALDKGFYRDALKDKKAELLAKRNMLLMAVMALFNLKMHTGEMTEDDVSSYLKNKLGLSAYRADVTAQRCRDRGTISASYYLGLLQIEQLKNEVLNKYPRMDEKEFHDRLLRCHPFPLPVVGGLAFNIELPELTKA